MGMARRPALGDSSDMASTTSSRAPRSFPRPRMPQRTHAAPAGEALSLRPRPGRCEKDVDSGEAGTHEFAPLSILPRERIPQLPGAVLLTIGDYGGPGPRPHPRRAGRGPFPTPARPRGGKGNDEHTTN